MKIYAIGSFTLEVCFGEQPDIKNLTMEVVEAIQVLSDGLRQKAFL